MGYVPERYAALTTARQTGQRRRGDPDPRILARMVALCQPPPDGEGLTPDQAVARFGMGSGALKALKKRLESAP